MKSPEDRSGPQDRLLQLTPRTDEVLAGCSEAEALRHSEYLQLRPEDWPPHQTLPPSQVPPPSEPAEAPTLVPAEAQVWDSPVSFNLPGYHLRAELGRGGMGVVYEAHDPRLDRRVAVKFVQTPRFQPRFLAEAQAVARLQHPHIVQIFELGECPGGLFLVLEFLPGGSLAHKLHHQPLPPRDSAALLETLARAVHHAHQQGVVHRDLKPANVMFTGDGQPKIVDFGLAKRLETGGETRHGEVLGTPDYMAPEQARGQSSRVGPAADVYSLGVMLYEMLAGHVPLHAEDLLTMLLLVSSEEPVPPRQFRPDVPRNLETICLKCLEKEPAKRYASTAALADDLRRWLDGHPIAARPVGRWERAWRWSQRNRLAAGLLATVFLTLLAAVVSLGSGLWIAERQRAETERRSRQYREALDELTSSLLEDLLARQQTLTEEHRALLRRTLARYEEFTRERGGDVESLAGLAEAFHRVGKIRYRLGENTEAETAYRQAISFQGRLLAEQPAIGHVHRLAWMRLNLARLLTDQGHVKEAEDILRGVLATSELGRGTEAEQREALEVHSMGQRLLFRVLEITGRTAEGETVLRASQKAYDRLLVWEPRSFRYRTMSLSVRLELGSVQGKLGKLEESEETFRIMVPALEQLLREQPGDMGLRNMLAATHTNRAETALLRRQPGLAETSLRAALALHTELAAGFPANPAHRQELATTYFRLARLLRSRQQYRLAEVEARTALQLQERLAMEYPDHLDYSIGVVHARHLLATLLDFLDRVPEADQEFQAAITAQEQLAEKHPRLTGLAVSLGGQYSDYGLFLTDRQGARQAKPWHDKAVECLTPLVRQEPDHLKARQNLLAAHRCRALVQTMLDQPAEAARDWERVLALEDKPRRDFRLHYALALAQSRRSTEALAAAAPVLEATDLSGEESYLAACLLAWVARESDPYRKGEFAAQAVAQLRAAHRLKWFATPKRREQLRQEPALAGLLSRQDFQQLLLDISPR